MKRVISIVAAAGAMAVLAGPALADTVIYDSNGFQGFGLGSLNGQDSWDTTGSTGPTTVPEVVDAFGTRAVKLAIEDLQGSNSVAGRMFGNILGMGMNKVTVSYDILRVADDWQSNLWWWWVDSGTPTYGLQWDSGSAHTSQTMPWGFDGPGVPVTFGVWQNITMTWDLASGMATSSIAGNPGPSLAIAGITSLSGWQFQLGHDEATGSGPEIAYVDNYRVTAVPEPGTVAAVAVGLGGLVCRWRRR